MKLEQAFAVVALFILCIGLIFLNGSEIKKLQKRVSDLEKNQLTIKEFNPKDEKAVYAK